MKKDCFEYKKNQSFKEHKLDSIEITENCDNVEVLNIVSSRLGGEWILDSGCSFLMSPNRHWFTDLKLGNYGTVLHGNDQMCLIDGVGNIKLKVHDGSYKVLIEVRYIPQLKRNLISLGVLETKVDLGMGS